MSTTTQHAGQATHSNGPVHSDNHPPPMLDDLPVPHTVMKTTNFFFKGTKDKETGVDIERRPTVKLDLPIPTIQGLAAALRDEKVQTYVLGLVEDAVAAAARQQVNDETSPVNKQEELNLSKLSLEYLANEPKTERAGRGIPKETWEAFAEDYIEIMPGLTNKPKDKVETAAGLFLKRLQSVRTNKPVLKALSGYLQLWFTHTSNAEEFSSIYEYLNSKVETFLNTTDEELLANL